jgi:hypothetical protein
MKMHLTFDEATSKVHPMKIDLNESELRTMLDMLTLSTIVASWEKYEEIEPELSAYLDLQQSIFAQLNDQGRDDLVEYVDEHEHYIVTDALHESFSYADFLDEFREDSFWADFVEHMADRDLIQRMGEEQFNRLSPEKRDIMADASEQRYWREVDQHGLEHFHLIHPQSS